MLRTLRRLAVAPEDLEDVAHDVFVAIHRQLPSYDPSRPLRPWVFSFVYRAARDYRASARRRYEIPTDAQTLTTASGAAGENPERAALTTELRAQLLDALEQLDFDKRLVFVLHDIDGVPVVEIAEQLQIPVNTAYSRLRLARTQLEKYLSPQQGGRP